jgi:hypothetical protein
VSVDEFGVLSGNSMSSVALGGGDALTTNEAGVSDTWRGKCNGTVATSDFRARSTAIALDKSWSYLSKVLGLVLLQGANLLMFTVGGRVILTLLRPQYQRFR